MVIMSTETRNQFRGVNFMAIKKSTLLASFLFTTPWVDGWMSRGNFLKNRISESGRLVHKSLSTTNRPLQLKYPLSKT